MSLAKRRSRRGSGEWLGPAGESSDFESANANTAIAALAAAATISDLAKPISSIITKADPTVPVMAPRTLATYR